MNTKVHKRLIIETSDAYMYDLFGTEDHYEPMVIDRKSIDYLEDYLNDYDESDEDDEPKMNDNDIKNFFNLIKNNLKKYKEVQVVYVGE